MPQLHGETFTVGPLADFTLSSIWLCLSEIYNIIYNKWVLLKFPWANYQHWRGVLETTLSNWTDVLATWFPITFNEHLKWGQYYGIKPLTFGVTLWNYFVWKTNIFGVGSVVRHFCFPFPIYSLNHQKLFLSTKQIPPLPISLHLHAYDSYPSHSHLSLLSKPPSSLTWSMVTGSTILSNPTWLLNNSFVNQTKSTPSAEPSNGFYAI